MYTDNRKRKVAHPFYSSGKWIATRDAYLRTVHYMCEICGEPARYVHHKDPLGEGDYFVNYEKCYGFANLEANCKNCHDRKPGHFLDGRGKQLVADGYRIDMQTGELEVVTPPHTDFEIGREKAVIQPYEKLGEEAQGKGDL